MPICPACGKTFSGFSFGANPATECSDCRKAKAQAANIGAIGTMNPSAPRAVARRIGLPPVTLTIMAANALVYVAMGVSGASWTDPSIADAVKWGADFGPLTLSSDWWRLFTSTFVHFGIIHIALNMWCLWNLGTTLEPFMGRKIFGVMYVASGIAASLVSVAWDPWRASAGASGAIFGVAGALVSYLALKKTPMDSGLVKRNLKSLGIFIFYNLLYGVRGGVDNSAHLGGLVAGLILGAAIPPMVRASADPQYILVGPSDMTRDAEGSRENRVAWTVALLSAAILVSGFIALHAKRISVARYGTAVKLIEAAKFEQATTQLQLAVKLDPDSFYPEMLLGDLLLAQQNPQAAVQAFQAAPDQTKKVYTFQHNLALAYLGTGQPSSALEWVVSSLRIHQEDRWRSVFVRAIAEGETGNHAAAVRDLESVIQAKPDFTEARDALAKFQALHDGGAAPQIEIPYDKLVMKSHNWPLYP